MAIDPAVLAKYSGSAQPESPQTSSIASAISKYSSLLPAGVDEGKDAAMAAANAPANDANNDPLLKVMEGPGPDQRFLNIPTDLGKKYALDPAQGAIFDTVADTANSLSTPRNIAITAGLGELGALAKVGGAVGNAAKAIFTGVSGYFAAEGIKAENEATKEFIKVMDDPNHTTYDLLRAGANLAPPAGIAIGAGIGAGEISKMGPKSVDVGPEAAARADLNAKLAPDTPPAVETPPVAPEPPAMPVPEKGPSLVDKIDSISGNESSPAATNAAINEALVQPPAPQPAAPVAEVPAPEAPAPAPSMPEPAAPHPQVTDPETPYEAPKGLTASQIAGLSNEHFHAYADAANQAGGSITGEAHHLGLEAVGDAAAITELARYRDQSRRTSAQIIAKAKAETDPVRKDALLNDLSVEATKSQFFSEAYGAATKTGSAGQYLTEAGVYNKTKSNELPIRTVQDNPPVRQSNEAEPAAGDKPAGLAGPLVENRGEVGVGSAGSAERQLQGGSTASGDAERLLPPASAAADRPGPTGRSAKGRVRASAASDRAGVASASESGGAASGSAAELPSVQVPEPGVSDTLRGRDVGSVGSDAANGAGVTNVEPNPLSGDAGGLPADAGNGSGKLEKPIVYQDPTEPTIEIHITKSARPEGGYQVTGWQLEGNGAPYPVGHSLFDTKAEAIASVEQHGIKPIGSEPTISNARLVGDTIYLSADVQGHVPTAKEIEEIFTKSGHKVHVAQFEPNLLSTANGEVKYRIDVMDETGKSSSAAAKKAYIEAFGSENPITDLTSIQRSLSPADRLNKTVKSLTPKSDAVQEQSPAALPVRPQPEGGEGVRQNDTSSDVQEPANTRQQAGTSNSETPPAGPSSSRVGPQSPASIDAATQLAKDKVAREAAGVKPPKPPTEVPREAPPAPEEPDPSEMAKTLQKRTSKALNSPSVDVAAKREIRRVIDEVTENDATKLKDLPVNVIQATLDKVDEQARIGRQEFKNREEARELEKVDLLAKISGDSRKSQAINTRPMEVNPGERLSYSDRIRRAMGNKWDQMMNSAVKAGTYLNTRDMELDALDGYQKHQGVLSRYLGGDIDRNFNASLTLADQFRKPLAEVLQKHKLDEASMERVSMYAIARQGHTARVLESGAKPSALYENASGMGPHELIKLTPGEQAFYDAARSTLDRVGAQVREMMHREYNVDVEMVKDYWPLQRDYNLYEAKPEAPAMKIGSGDEASQSIITSFKNLFDDFLPIKTTKTKQGFTISRLPGAKGPVLLNAAEGLEQHFRQAAHLLANQRDLRMWGEIARRPEFKSQYGDVGQKYVLELLDTVARNSSPIGTKGWPVVDAAMKNLSAAVLGLRLLSQGKHITNVFSAAKEIRPNHLMAGLMDRASGEGHLFLQNNRPEILNRFGGEQSIQDIAGRSSPLHKVNTLAKVQKATFGIERAIDSVLAEGSWLGSYRQELQKLGYNPDAYAKIPLVQEAARMADITARKVVTSPALKDVSQVLSRNKFTANHATLRRALFQFQSTMLRQASQMGHELVSAKVNKDPAAAAATLMVAMALIGGEVYITHANRELKHAVMGGPPPKEVSFSQEVARDMLRRVPVVGPAFAGVQDKDTGLPIVETFTTTKDALRHLVTGQNEYGKKSSNLQSSKDKIDLATGIASVLGFPAATSIGEFMKTGLPRERKY